MTTRKNKYKVENAHGGIRKYFSNNSIAEKYARMLSRNLPETIYLATLKHDSPSSHPEGRWDVTKRFRNGFVTLYP